MSGVSGITRLVAGARDAGQRLDVFLAGATALSRRRARTLVSDGLVWRNGRALRVQSRELEAGDVIDILRPAAELGCPQRPDAPAVDVLFEESWLLAALKPAGELSQPAENMETGEMAFDQRVLLHLAVRDGHRPFLRLVHRLDRATSGVLLFATHGEALPLLTRAWAEGQVSRHYVALTAGQADFDQLEIDRPIARDPSHRWRFRVAQDGKPAITRVRSLATTSNGHSLLVCTLLTGRTHQVRVHLAALGMPVLGDVLYGAAPLPTEAGLMLHAAALTLPHPRTGATVHIEAPLPARFAPHLSAADHEALGRLLNQP